MSLTCMYITNDLDIALIAQKYGVDRIWIDLETLGKEERQPGLDTVKSKHSIEDIQKIAPHLTTSQMFVRVNPWNPSSITEIEAVIQAGADVVMLPMWKTVDEVKQFLDTVRGRAKTSLLLETIEAQNILEHVLELDGIDEIHIGLNDLHLAYGLDFMFELLSNGTVEQICQQIGNKNISFGFGGVSRLGDGLLPAELILSEHYRLHSSRVILSRSFCDIRKVTDLVEIESLFRENMQAFRHYEQKLTSFSEQDFEENHQKIVEVVEQIKRKK